MRCFRNVSGPSASSSLRSQASSRLEVDQAVQDEALLVGNWGRWLVDRDLFVVEEQSGRGVAADVWEPVSDAENQTVLARVHVLVDLELVVTNEGLEAVPLFL